MDLAELKFVVKTEQLEEAVTKIEELGVAVSKLNKPMQDLTSNTKKVSTATDTATKSTDSKTKADEKAAETASKLDTLLKNLKYRYTDMAEGSTTAESSILRLARSLGATTDTALKPYKDILQEIRGLSSNPFDSAIGSIRSIQQEYDSLTYRAELAAKGIFLTTSQLKEYSRIANEIKGKLKASDLDPTKGEGLAKFNSELKKQQDEYLGIANSVNTLKAAEKERNDLLSSQMKESAKLQEASDNLFKNNLLKRKEKETAYLQDMAALRKHYSDLEKESKQVTQAAPAQMDAAVIAYRKNQAKVTEDAARANAYLAKEIERVNRLNAESDTITSTTNNRLIRFEKELRASGASAAQAAVKLEAYKKSLIATQKAAKDGQIDYLSRALGPQITDIAVGLATGQAPLTILLQQGGQLRDQFALAGVAGAEMGDMLVKATSSMITSVKDVGVAIGSALVGAITNSGAAITKFAMDVTGTNTALENMRYQIALFEKGSSGPLMRAFLAIGSAITFVVGLILFSAIVAFIALAVSINAVIKEENALNRALNLTGAAMGLTLDSAYDAARAMNQFGVSTGTALEVLTEMAKIGGMSSKSLEMVGTTAKAMKTAFEIPIADTVKQFKELQEKPTEALTKLAIKLGTIPVEILKQVEAYEKAGNSIKAAELAMKTYEEAGKKAADRTIEEFGAITRLGIEIGEIWDKTWEKIMGAGRRATPLDELKKSYENLGFLKTQRGADNEKSDVGRRISATVNRINELETQLLVQQQLKDEEAKNAADVKKYDDDRKKREEAAKKTKDDAINSQKEFADELNRARKFYDDQVAAVENLTKSERALREARKSKGYKAGSPEGKKEIEQFYERADAEERLVQAEKDAATATELKNKLLGQSESLGAEYYKTIDLINKYAKEGRFGADEVLQLKAALEATTPQARRLAAAQADNAKIMADIAAERGAISEQYGGDFKTADEKAAIKNLSDYRKKTAEADAQYTKQIADAGKNITDAETEMYKAQAAQKKALAEDVYDREQYLLSDGFKRSKAQSDAMEGLFKGMGDALVDFALTGKTSFSDMVNSMIVNLIKLEMQMAMTSMYKSMGGSSSIVSAITSIFTGSPEQLSGPGTPVPFAKGGTFTNSIVDSPTMFKFAKGTGLMGEAGPEAIMPLRRGSDGSLGVVASGGSSGGNVSVQVINNSSSQATTNETVDSKGNRKIEVVIGDMTAGEISRSGSASQRSIKSTFGLQPQLIRR